MKVWHLVGKKCKQKVKVEVWHLVGKKVETESESESLAPGKQEFLYQSHQSLDKQTWLSSWLKENAIKS